MDRASAGFTNRPNARSSVLWSGALARPMSASHWGESASSASTPRKLFRWCSRSTRQANSWALVKSLRLNRLAYAGSTSRASSWASRSTFRGDLLVSIPHRLPDLRETRAGQNVRVETEHT
jgi:hypothetical protein